MRTQEIPKYWQLTNSLTGTSLVFEELHKDRTNNRQKKTFIPLIMKKRRQLVLIIDLNYVPYVFPHNEK